MTYSEVGFEGRGKRKRKTPTRYEGTIEVVVMENGAVEMDEVKKRGKDSEEARMLQTNVTLHKALGCGSRCPETGCKSVSIHGGSDDFKTVLERSHPPLLPPLSFPALLCVCVVCGGMRWCGSVLTLTHSGLALQHCVSHGGGSRCPETGCQNGSAGGGGEGLEKVLERSHPPLLPPLSFPASRCVVCGACLCGDVLTCLASH